MLEERELLEIILNQKFLILMEKYGYLLVYFQKIFMDLELLVFKIKYYYVEGITKINQQEIVGFMTIVYLTGLK